MTISLRNKIISSTFWNILSKTANYLRYLIIASYIGLGFYYDSFTYAEATLSLIIMFPNSLLNIITIPRLSFDYKENYGEFQKGFSTILLSTFIWSIFFCGSILLFSSHIIHILYPGLKQDLASFVQYSLIFLIPYGVLSLSNEFMSSILDIKRRHSLIFIIEFLRNLSALLLICLFVRERFILFISLSFSAILHFVIAIAIFRKDIILYFNFKYLKQLIHKISYLALFISCGYVFGVIDRFYISYLPEGSISSYRYSLLISGIINSIIPIGRILYPYLSTMNGKEQLSLLRRSLESILLIFLPLVIFVLIFPDMIPQVLFGYGKISALQISQMGSLLRIIFPYAIVGLMIGLLDKILYLHNLYKPLVYRILAAIVINGIGGYLSVFVFNWGLNGIVFFTAILHFFIFISSYRVIESTIVGSKPIISVNV